MSFELILAVVTVFAAVSLVAYAIGTTVLAHPPQQRPYHDDCERDESDPPGQHGIPPTGWDGGGRGGDSGQSERPRAAISQTASTFSPRRAQMRS